MAEITEIIEGVEDVVDGVEEGAEGLPEEEQAEIESEVSEAREAISGLSESLEEFKNFVESLKAPLANATKFVLKNVAIGAIFWGVTTGLTKLTQGESSKQRKMKRDVIKALTNVISSETDLSKKALSWIKDHQDDKITLEGYEVPLESIMVKYLSPVTKAVDEAFDIANKLQTKTGGKVQLKLPNAGDIMQFLAAADVFLQSFSDLVEFTFKSKEKFHQLASFPVTQADMKELKSQIEKARALPLW